MDFFDLKYRSFLLSIVNEAMNDDFGDAPDPSTFGNDGGDQNNLGNQEMGNEDPNNQNPEQKPEASLEDRKLSDPLKLFMAKLTFQVSKMDPEDKRLKNFRLTDYKNLDSILKNNPNNNQLFNLAATVIRKLKPFGENVHNSIPELQKLNDRDGSKNNILKTWLEYIFSFVQYNKMSSLGFAKGEQLKAFDEINNDNLDSFESAIRDVST